MNIARPAALVAVVACAMVSSAVGCSTASKSGVSGGRPEAGAPGATACQVQGYFDELDGGGCPDATCQVAAVDTNGGRLACCTSVASGPGRCLDEGDAETTDAATGDAAGDGPGDAPVDAPTDGPDEATPDAPADATSDGATDAPGDDGPASD